MPGEDDIISMTEEAELPLIEVDEDMPRDLRGVLKMVLALAFIGLVLFIAVGVLRYFMVRYYGGW